MLGSKFTRNEIHAAETGGTTHGTLVLVSNPVPPVQILRNFSYLISRNAAIVKKLSDSSDDNCLI